ncbi:hypothetical protein DFH06DRAFT_1099830 [Mycena polygramma]|nr:hypothetical protein DFH06DRAFT_1099830 [Mycena polygramma]
MIAPIKTQCHSDENKRRGLLSLYGTSLVFCTHLARRRRSLSTMKRAILPAVGACAVFTIDPIASLDSDTQSDPEAVAACEKLVSKKYAVLVTGREGLYAPWNPYNISIVHFILQGDPRSDPERCMEPSMTLPIVPMTIKAHPSSRDPLNPSNPLPWNDCYISCFFHATLRSPTLFTTEPILHTIDSDQLIKGDSLLAADVERQKRLARIKENTPSVPSTSPPATQSPIATQIVASQVVVSSSASALHATHTTAEDEHDGDDESSTSDEILHDILTHRPTSQVIVTVKFTHDLSTLDVLSDPAEYTKEVEAIVRIQEEAWPRVARAKAQATKDAIKAGADKDAAAYDNRTVNLLVERSTFKRRISRVASKVKSKSRSIARVIIRFARPARNK